MDKEIYRKKNNLAPDYVLRWVNTVEMVVGAGVLIAGSITKDKELSDWGLYLGAVGYIQISYELGKRSGEKQFYKEGSDPYEKSTLTKRIRDFYLPPKKEKL